MQCLLEISGTSARVSCRVARGLATLRQHPDRMQSHVGAGQVVPELTTDHDPCQGMIRRRECVLHGRGHAEPARAVRIHGSREVLAFHGYPDTVDLLLAARDNVYVVRSWSGVLPS